MDKKCDLWGSLSHRPLITSGPCMMWYGLSMWLGVGVGRLDKQCGISLPHRPLMTHRLQCRMDLPCGLYPHGQFMKGLYSLGLLMTGLYPYGHLMTGLYLP